MRSFLKTLICPPPGSAFVVACTAAFVLALVAGCSSGSRRSAGQPSDLVLVKAAEAEATTAPFSLVTETGEAEPILSLTDGDHQNGQCGEAVYRVKHAGGGHFHLWCRVWWQDGCGNSFELKAPGSPPRIVGEDAVYRQWHWVRAGTVDLTQGEVALVVREREDGVRLAQLALTQDAAFIPQGDLSRCAARPGPMQVDGERQTIGETPPAREPAVQTALAEPRRFGDDFDRSPGHGLGPWDVLAGEWQVLFDFDPNRIPLQFSMQGTPAADGPGICMIKEPAWSGCSLTFSLLPMEPGAAGAVLDWQQGEQGALSIDFALQDDGTANLKLAGAVERTVPLHRAYRLRQWHRVRLERWADVLRVELDGQLCYWEGGLPQANGRAGLRCAFGSAAFDDVRATQLVAEAERPGASVLPWTLDADAAWSRVRGGSTPLALLGTAGCIRLDAGGLPLRELRLHYPATAHTRCRVLANGQPQRPARQTGALEVYRFPEAGVPAVALGSNSEVALAAIDVLHAPDESPTYVIGPYHFARPDVLDPSDYLDFTEEEWQQIRHASDASRIGRVELKTVPLLSREERSFFRMLSGNWRLADQALQGTGPNAELAFSVRFGSPCRLSCRLRAARADAVAELEVYGGTESGTRVRLGGEDPGAAPGLLWLPLPAADQWHELQFRVGPAGMTASLDNGPQQRCDTRQGLGETLFLRVLEGHVEFDDLLVQLPRRDDNGWLYAFDRRETGWWRDSTTWQDHAGITCMYASNWISLISPDSQSIMWHKAPIGSDVSVTFTVDENSDWYGRRHRPTHVHHPYNNLCLWLSTGDSPSTTAGYRLEVNAQDGRFTILSRNGVEVARVSQKTAGFPLHRVAGHAPYSPRSNRIGLRKEGGILRGVVDGKEVIRYVDPEPLEVHYVGLGGDHTRANFALIEVRNLTPTLAVTAPP